MPAERGGLDASTQMATPRGWRAAGELGRGDEIFAADGLPCRVVSVGEHAQADGQVLELRLCDGSRVACAASQPWLVEADAEVRLLTAGELALSFRRGDPPRFSIALPAPLEHRFAELSSDPYELGARLGSGMLEEACGIPRPFLEADVLQRRELLMGLLDEGGGVGADGSVHFDTVHQRLARDVRELVVSLGHRATTSTGGGPRGSYKRVSFRTTEPVFGLRAPAEQLLERASPASDCRWIVDVGEVGWRPTCAIEVDAESHLLIAGEGALITPDAALAASVEGDARPQLELIAEVLA